jgi:hypothetical protein
VGKKVLRAVRILNFLILEDKKKNLKKKLTCIQNFSQISGGTRPLGSSRRRRKGAIKVGHIKIGLLGVDWMHLSQVRGTFEQGSEPSGSIKGGEFRG